MTGRDLPACTVAIVAAGTLAARGAEPAESAPSAGGIEGEIEPAGLVTKVSAIDRDVKQKAVASGVAVRETQGRVLSGGGKYAIEVAPGTYDLHVELADGRVIEGADLRVREPRGGTRPIRARDRDHIASIVGKMRTWANERHLLALRGSTDRAKALVKLVRTKPTSYDGQFGEPVAVVRWEIWNFRKYTGSWRRESKAKVLRRFLFPRRELPGPRWEFEPNLGGLEVVRGTATRRDLDFRPKSLAETPTESARPPPEPPPGFARRSHFPTVRTGAR